MHQVFRLLCAFFVQQIFVNEVDGGKLCFGSSDPYSQIDTFYSNDPDSLSQIVLDNTVDFIFWGNSPTVVSAR